MTYKRCSDAFAYGKLRRLSAYEYGPCFRKSVDIFIDFRDQIENGNVLEGIDMAIDYLPTSLLIINKSAKSDFTELINKLHNDRREELKNFYSALIVLAKMKSPETFKSAEYIIRELQKYKIDEALRNQKRMDGFLDQFEGMMDTDQELIDAVTNLNLMRSVSVISEAYAQYRMATKGKAVKYGANGKISLDMTQIRNKAQEILSYTFMAIDADIYFSKSDRYQILLHTLRGVLTPYITLANSRISGSKKSNSTNNSTGDDLVSDDNQDKLNDSNEGNTSGDNQNESMGSGDDNTNNNDGELGDGVMTASSMPINEPMPLENGGSTENHNMSEPESNGYEDVGNSVGF